MTGFSANIAAPIAGAGAAVAGAATGGFAAGGAVGGVMGVANAIGSMVPAILRSLDAGFPFAVPFDFNPTKIVIKRTAKGDVKPAAGGGSGAPTGSLGAVVWNVPPPEITISDIIFEGLTTKLRCDTIFSWMSPPKSMLGGILGGAGTPIQSKPPKVTFQWGLPAVGFWYDVNITSASVTYERFNGLGMPVRAKVTLQMTQLVSKWANLPTNPTSGGLPGRRTHVLKSGESLHSLATQYYGNPGAWRRIADINNLNNPARVRPGTTVYLPAPEELATGGQ